MSLVDFKKGPMSLVDFKKGPMSLVDFKKGPMSLVDFKSALFLQFIPRKWTPPIGIKVCSTPFTIVNHKYIRAHISADLAQDNTMSNKILCMIFIPCSWRHLNEHKTQE